MFRFFRAKAFPDFDFPNSLLWDCADALSGGKFNTDDNDIKGFTELILFYKEKIIPRTQETPTKALKDTLDRTVVAITEKMSLKEADEEPLKKLAAAVEEFKKLQFDSKKKPWYHCFICCKGEEQSDDEVLLIN